MLVGEAELNAAKAKGYVEGDVDRVTGRKNAVVGAIFGDKGQQAEGKSIFTCSGTANLKFW